MRASDSSMVWVFIFLRCCSAISADSVWWQIMAMSLPAWMASWTSGPLPYVLMMAPMSRSSVMMTPLYPSWCLRRFVRRFLDSDPGRPGESGSMAEK